MRTQEALSLAMSPLTPTRLLADRRTPVSLVKATSRFTLTRGFRESDNVDIIREFVGSFECVRQDIADQIPAGILDILSGDTARDRYRLVDHCPPGIIAVEYACQLRGDAIRDLFAGVAVELVPCRKRRIGIIGGAPYQATVVIPG
jgi:hypothetical protein